MRRTLVPLLSTRGVVLWGAMLIAVALLIASLTVSPKKAEAAPKLVTKSFSNPHQILIPEGAPTATIGAALPYPRAKVSSFPRGSKVRDVNVTIRNYTHTSPNNVDVLLFLKGTGVNRTIMSDVGGGNDVNNITLKLDDESANGPLSDTGQLGGGIFQPTNAEGGDTFDFPAPNPASANSSLSGFGGKSANGTWQLFVQDDSSSDTGRIAGGWTVQIKAAVPR